MITGELIHEAHRGGINSNENNNRMETAPNPIQGLNPTI